MDAYERRMPESQIGSMGWDFCPYCPIFAIFSNFTKIPQVPLPSGCLRF
jgi:hypothetical protein